MTELKPIGNLKQLYQGSQWQFTQAEESDIKSRVYVKGAPEFTTKIYENVGKQLLVSILDLFEWNPVSRIPHTEFKNLKAIRKEIATEVIRSDRFKKISPTLGFDMKEVADLAEKKVIHSLKVTHFIHRFIF